MLSSATPPDPNQALPDGTTPLIVAAITGHEPIVRLLLKAGADATAVWEGGDTALDGALEQGHPTAALPLALAVGPHHPNPAVAALFKPSSGRRPPPARPPPARPQRPRRGQ